MYECCPTHLTEIESVDQLLRHVEATGSLQEVVVQGLDLTGEPAEAALTSVSAEDACFLGCRLTDAAEDHVHETGGTVFPAFVGVPFNPYRAALYTPDELMQGYERGQPETRTETTDAAIYEYFKGRQLDGRDAPVMDALAFRIHDHAVDDALRDLLRPDRSEAEGGSAHGAHPDDGPVPRVVGVMGGHQLGRDTDTYRQVARIGWRLAQNGFLVATGGGPGAMEAANLGAALADYDADAVDDAVDTLAAVPHYEDDAYVDRALDVRERYPDRTESLAVPTWFYGHEPSNLFPTHVAKYFANSIREDGLLAIATYGVIYAPGSAGTVQEVFMDAAQNHYETVGAASPMVFFDETYWTEEKPVYPLLQTLAEGTPYADELRVTDDVDTVAAAIADHAATRAS
jgi:predicted Rossmann-fold nucleotide-binding protein